MICTLCTRRIWPWRRRVRTGRLGVVHMRCFDAHFLPPTPRYSNIHLE